MLDKFLYVLGTGLVAFMFLFIGGIVITTLQIRSCVAGDDNSPALVEDAGVIDTGVFVPVDMSKFDNK